MQRLKKLVFSSSVKLIGCFLSNATLLSIMAGNSLHAETGVVTQTKVLFEQPSVSFGTAEPFAPVKYYNGSVYFVWVDANYRSWVTKITNGVSKIAPLDASDYHVQADGHHRFSLGIDTDCYIHVTGDMHNHSLI